MDQPTKKVCTISKLKVFKRQMSRPCEGQWRMWCLTKNIILSLCESIKGMDYQPLYDPLHTLVQF
jgi:hypothetical protein